MRPILERVDAEIAAGRTWRAKEIISGNIASHWPDAAVVERYGQILLALGEQMEAGKFLFLSGARRPEYDAAIELFLSRHSRQDRRAILGQLPKALRRLPFDSLPAVVRDDLAARGVTPNSFRPPTIGTPVRYSQGVAGVVVGVTLLVCLLVGLFVVGRAIVTLVLSLFR